MAKKKDWKWILYPNCYNNTIVKTLTEKEIKKLRSNYDRNLSNPRPVIKLKNSSGLQTGFLFSLMPNIWANALFIYGPLDFSFGLVSLSNLAKLGFKRTESRGRLDELTLKEVLKELEK